MKQKTGYNITQSPQEENGSVIHCRKRTQTTTKKVNQKVIDFLRKVTNKFVSTWLHHLE